MNDSKIGLLSVSLDQEKTEVLQASEAVRQMAHQLLRIADELDEGVIAAGEGEARISRGCEDQDIGGGWLVQIEMTFPLEKIKH